MPPPHWPPPTAREAALSTCVHQTPCLPTLLPLTSVIPSGSEAQHAHPGPGFRSFRELPSGVRGPPPHLSLGRSPEAPKVTTAACIPHLLPVAPNQSMLHHCHALVECLQGQWEDLGKI